MIGNNNNNNASLSLNNSLWLFEEPCAEKGIVIAIIYLEDVYLVTALVPSETACFANSPGSSSLTAV